MHEFNPETFQDLVALVGGKRNASFRMVLGYWDMAASLVTSGAIGADSFLAAHGEIFITFSKVHPLLGELRAATGETHFCRHMESVVMSAPDAEAVLALAAEVRPRNGQVESGGRGSRRLPTFGDAPTLANLTPKAARARS